MPQITFRKVADDEALILHDGELVGELYRHDDPLTGLPVYLVSIYDNGRPWGRVHDRNQVRDTILDLLRQHPTLGWCYS